MECCFFFRKKVLVDLFEKSLEEYFLEKQKTKKCLKIKKKIFLKENWKKEYFWKQLKKIFQKKFQKVFQNNNFKKNEKKCIVSFFLKTFIKMFSQKKIF